MLRQSPPAAPLLYPEHSDLSYYLDPNGYPRPILTPGDWQIRRQHVIAHMQQVMGKLPDRSQRVPLNLQPLEEVPLEGLIREKIEYQTEADTRVRAYLFRPAKKAAEKLPAVLCLHQTIGIGKQEPAGLGGSPNLHYALHLAQRGYVTLAPDYPSFGDYKYDFAPAHGYISGSMKAIWDNMRAIDLLEALPQVDPKRIGCIGHSLGGHNTMFTAVFDERIKALVSNCGFTRFPKYYGGALKGWTSDRYMPLINKTYANNPNLVPFDFPEIVAAFAPRAFLASSPKGDSNFEVSGVVDSIASAQRIYDLLGVSDRLQANYPDCAHDFPEEVRKVAYAFFDRHLQP
ncbi:MAG: Prolyl oligopeptidase family protein [Planctomycetaceae bacterium]|nr:Prolyl oligopeptidase family protein [Planctomycetaceae bacterium]